MAKKWYTSVKVIGQALLTGILQQFYTVTKYLLRYKNTIEYFIIA